jgi:hypothetical protein
MALEDNQIIGIWAEAILNAHFDNNGMPRLIEKQLCLKYGKAMILRARVSRNR